MSAPDFSAQIRIQGGAKPYSEYKMSIFMNLKKMEFFTPLYNHKSTLLGFENQKFRILAYFNPLYTKNGNVSKGSVGSWDLFH